MFLLCSYTLQLLSSDGNKIIRHDIASVQSRRQNVLDFAPRSHMHLGRPPLTVLRAPTQKERRIAELEDKLLIKQHADNRAVFVNFPFFLCIAGLGMLSKNPEFARAGLIWPHDMTITLTAIFTTYIVVLLREFYLLNKIAEIEKQQ